MKRSILLFFLLLLFGLVHAKRVSVNVARTAGQTFLRMAADAPDLKSNSDIRLVYKAMATSLESEQSVDSLDLFFVFSNDTKGFVIVAGDDNVIPILGYSGNGRFSPDSLPQNFAKWLEGYKSQIRFILTNNILATEQIVEEWRNLTSDGPSSPISQSSTSVNPLLKTQWNQSPWYNDLCPGGSVTGCVATAMAQIMKYWNYPASGAGFHSYKHDKYGTLSSNFGGTTYDWNSMPNVVTSKNDAVATLMFQVGVSVDMGYSPESSGAYVISAQSPVVNCSEYALKTYFGYKASLAGVKRENYSDAQWMTLVKSELSAGRPVLYAGFGSGGGHCFVADGVDNNDYIHMNWGWGGYYDGYFQINALNPSGVGTGGGSGGFNSGHQAVIGITPPSQIQTYDLALYDIVHPSSSKISYGQSFTVSTNIANQGTATFTGDYAAAIFDNAYNFVDFVQTLSGYSLQNGYAYTNNLVFSSGGLLTVLPGSYYIGIFYRPTGLNWVQVANNGSYTNLVPLTVEHPSDMELYSPIIVSPGLELVQGTPASVNVNLINTGNNTFTGEYSVALYNLDGTFVQEIGTVSETAGLPHNYVYLSPFLTFSTSSITADPGSYLLAVLHKSTGSDWQLTGSTNYQNPIRVTVLEPAIKPDRYGNNNSTGQAFQLTAGFSADKANCNTDGANCHIESDIDYYKIVLPPGFNYTIKPRLHDSNNSGNGNVYTLDGLFSYSFDGSKWSGAFDDVMSGNISLGGGGTLYFSVAPFFAGETGTYLLDINLSRTNASGIDVTEIDGSISVYPNPASGFLNIDLHSFTGNIREVGLIDMNGQKMIRQTEVIPGTTILLPLTGFPDGMYILELQSDKEVFTKKIVIKK